MNIRVRWNEQKPKTAVFLIQIFFIVAILFSFFFVLEVASFTEEKTFANGEEVFAFGFEGMNYDAFFWAAILIGGLWFLIRYVDGEDAMPCLLCGENIFPSEGKIVTVKGKKEEVGVICSHHKKPYVGEIIYEEVTE